MTWFKVSHIGLRCGPPFFLAGAWDDLDLVLREGIGTSAESGWAEPDATGEKGAIFSRKEF